MITNSNEPLDQWNNVLENRFTALGENKGPGIPIFALEHGLGSKELGDLFKDIRDFISFRAPHSDHRLVWVVYATELGYRYSGTEFWQTFESKTPGWSQRGNRYWIRNSFIEFTDKFNGAKPTGIWADHFTIICWPITNAILPSDLQRHLARDLFLFQGLINRNHLESPEELGALIASRSAGHGNSRYFQFLGK